MNTRTTTMPGGVAPTLGFDEAELVTLLAEFRAASRRAQDQSLATRLEAEVLNSDKPIVQRRTVLRLAKWCKTNGYPYGDGMIVARKISLLLFGHVLRREDFGV
jgi:hypothetical protein